MPKIVWDDTFCLGIDEIDEQHRQWIEMINRLHDSLIGGDDVDKITEKILRDMLDYGRFHLTFEEDLLERNDYPALAAHRRVHERFMDKLKGMIAENRAGGFVLNTEIMKFMTNWLVDHILTEDRAFVSSIKTNGPSRC